MLIAEGQNELAKRGMWDVAYSEAYACLSVINKPRPHLPRSIALCFIMCPHGAGICPPERDQTYIPAEYVQSIG